MCKLGDIIVVKEFKNEYGDIVPKHSFVIINDEEDYVEGFRYDFVSNMLCSFHDEDHKKKKLKYEQNLPVREEKISGENINNKEGFIKADQLYYFNKNKIQYKVLAHIDPELLDELVQLILKLKEKGLLQPIITNIITEEVH